MTDRFVGPGGADGNDGLSWANRKLTLNGVEDTPVVAGDTVYVGPGVYRELLTVDVAGTSGAVITYIADVTGENTDDIGGIVRITGSDDDQSATRANCIALGSGDDFRTFRGFMMDTCTSHSVVSNSVDSLIVEDCVFQANDAGGALNVFSANQANHIIRRSLFMGSLSSQITFTHSGTLDDVGHLVENCVFVGGGTESINISRVGGITVKNCTFAGTDDDHIDVTTALSGGQTTIVNNCIFYGAGNAALEATVTGEITENFNTFYGNQIDRTNVATGASSQTYPPIFLPPLFYDGQMFPWWAPFNLTEWSQIGRIAGTSEATDDLFGIVRPTTSAKNSWGAVQLREAERETGTVQTGSAALTLADAGDHQVYVPVTATSTTFEVAARYESEYAGTLPRLIVRQPGQADQVDTMVAAADTWETLSLTFTPNATPPYVVIILRSLNTSVTGDYDTYWDDLDVS